MKVLSLFDGISCGMVALERAGIKVDKYTAYEIDENAIKISRANYPQIEHKGDVFKAEYKQGEYDLLIGGSPCTYWSIATAGNGTRETVSSGLGWDLFSQYVRALHEVKPKYFLYENNESMSDNIKHEITKQLGVEPIMIDSADFSAQVRKRYYWTNIPIDLNYEKINAVIKDIIYDNNYKVKDFKKYKDTAKFVCGGKSIKWDTSGKGYYSQSNRATNKNVKMNAVITTQNHMNILLDNVSVKWDSSGKGHYSQQNRARSPELKMNTVTARGVDKCNIYLGDCNFRPIHPIEAERLQTLPDNYTNCLSSHGNRIKAIGNGWTVDVIAHILKGLK